MRPSLPKFCAAALFALAFAAPAAAVNLSDVISDAQNTKSGKTQTKKKAEAEKKTSKKSKKEETGFFGSIGKAIGDALPGEAKEYAKARAGHEIDKKLGGAGSGLGYSALDSLDNAAASGKENKKSSAGSKSRNSTSSYLNSPEGNARMTLECAKQGVDMKNCNKIKRQARSIGYGVDAAKALSGESK
jgi:hypothetical protein